jgi:DNA-binding transcriptional LysR family regulator
MRDLNDLFLYVQVVDHRGFAPAGRALGVPKSRISRRISLLEERLGVRLLQRSSRRFAVTEIGQEYYQHCAAMLVEADAAEEVIDRSRSQPQGVVRLSCPSALVHFQVAPMLARFMAGNPRVQVHLESTNRRVDVIREGFDIALRVRFPPLEDTDLVMNVLADSTQRLVAHPHVLQGRPGPVAPEDLAGLPSMDLGPPNREHEWSLVGPDGATALVRHAPRLVTDDMVALHAAALQAVGVVQMPAMMVLKDLLLGNLVEVLPQWAPRSGVIHAVFPSRRGLLPSVRGLLDFLGSEFAAQAREERESLSIATGPGAGTGRLARAASLPCDGDGGSRCK